MSSIREDTSHVSEPPATVPAVERATELLREAESVLGNPPTGFGHGVFPLPAGRLLALPRTSGDSRYPYGAAGFNFWVHASGYMHANEGLFSIFPRRAEGQEPTIAFFVRRSDDDDSTLHAISGMPDFGNPTALRATVFERACAWHLLKADGLAHALRVYPLSAQEMLFSAFVTNESSRPAEFTLFAYFNPLMRHQIHDTDEDRWFKKVVPFRSDDASAGFVVEVNEDKDRFSSITNRMHIQRTGLLPPGAMLVATEQTPSREQFIGSAHRHVLQAESLRTGHFGRPLSASGFRENAVAGDLLRLRLDPGRTLRVDWSLSVESDVGENAPTRSRTRGTVSPEARDRRIADRELQLARAAKCLTLKVEEPDEEHANAPGAIAPGVFSHFFQHLKSQVEFCSLIKGYVQLSENSLIGIRDVFQALEGLLYWRPDAARAKMLEALSYTLCDGRCPRQYSLPARSGAPGKADLRPFIDQGVWVISAIATYLRVTGDVGFLEEAVGFHEVVDEAAGRIRPAQETSTVLDHLQRILDYLLRHRCESTGCIRALYGDWNDALDGLGLLPDGSPGFGDGVTVMASLQALQNLDEMIEILRLAKTSDDEIERLARERKALAEGLRANAVVRDEVHGPRILHGWGHARSYLVGSHCDPDGAMRDSSTSNAFWALSGLLRETPELRPAILDAFRRLDSKYGIRTFHPHFPPNTPGVGRIGKLPPGTAENGAVYVHATAFAVMALFEMGEARWAWEQLERILPFTAMHQRLSHSPFVMPNSYSLNSELGLDGENMNDWQTGSSNVVLKTLIRHVIGFQPLADRLRIAPANWCPFDRWSCSLPYRGGTLTITRHRYRNGRRTYRLDDLPVESTHDEAVKAEVLEIPFDRLPPRRDFTVSVYD